MIDGGYDIGYKNCDCFWGINPGSLILRLENLITSFEKKIVLDLGCGEGKNALYLANKGCRVEALDISEYAIKNAEKIIGTNSNITLNQADASLIEISADKYDIIIAYGLFHCFRTQKEVANTIRLCIDGLKKDGILLICAFNSRFQDLSAHDGFTPLLLSHREYLNFFSENRILFETDSDLIETHPHNQIQHTHSMTRIIIQK